MRIGHPGAAWVARAAGHEAAAVDDRGGRRPDRDRDHRGVLYPRHVVRCTGVGRGGRRGHGDPQLARRHRAAALPRSEEHTSELQSLMRISYAVFCSKNKITYLSPVQLHIYETLIY